MHGEAMGTEADGGQVPEAPGHSQLVLIRRLTVSVCRHVRRNAKRRSAVWDGSPERTGCPRPTVHLTQMVKENLSPSSWEG